MRSVGSRPTPKLKRGGEADVALRLVESAFERLRRPLRVRDLYEEAVEQGVPELVTDRLSSTLSRLIQYGFLTDVGRVRGIRSGGTRQVVPAGRTHEAVCRGVASWPQRVVDAMLVLWAEHAAEASSRGVLPLPVSTVELRQRLAQDPANAADLGRPNGLPSVIRNLLKLNEPPVRTIGGRSRTGSFFVPADVSNAEVDISSLVLNSDSDRVVEAARRAAVTYGRPLVTRREILAEIDRDSALTLSGPTSRARAIDRITQSTLYQAAGRHHARRVQRVSVVGRIGWRAHYCLGIAGPVELAWAEMLRMQLALRALEADGAGLISCSLPALRSARLSRAAVRIADATVEVQRLATALAGDGSASPILSELERRIADVAAALADLAPAATHAAPTPCEAGPVARELRLIDPAIAEADAFCRVVQIAGPGAARKEMRPMLRRNVAWWSRDDGARMYERAGLLLASALWWGGPTTVTNAMLASAQLGNWRAPTPLLVDLDNPDPEHRLAAIACSAFLACPASLARLRRMAESDAEPGLRLSAVWALGIAEAPGADRLVHGMANGDDDPWVRDTASRFAAAAAQADGRGWFAV